MNPTALDAPPGQLDEHDQRFVGLIREHGWARTNVFEDDAGPGFNYTTGFQVTLGHPEIVVFDWQSELAATVLWDIYRAVEAGRAPAIGTPTDEFTSRPLVPLPVSVTHYREYLGWNCWFYNGDDFECLQLVWPDSADIFPWQEGFDVARYGNLQPDLTGGGWRGHPTA